MSLKYEILKRFVRAANIKKQWIGMTTEDAPAEKLTLGQRILAWFRGY